MGKIFPEEIVAEERALRDFELKNAREDSPIEVGVVRKIGEIATHVGYGLYVLSRSLRHHLRPPASGDTETRRKTQRNAFLE